MYRVTVEASFCASHQLRLPSGELEPLHGHNWKVEARFAGPELNAWGVLVDFVEVQAALGRIADDLNGRHLNEMEELKALNPSAENVARVIFGRLKASGAFGEQLASIRLWEAPGCSAAYFHPMPP